MKLFALFLLVKLLFHSGMHLLVWFLFDIITILILLCETSDNKILSTVEKIFKTVNTWSVRVEIPSSEFFHHVLTGVCTSNFSEKCWKVILTSYEFMYDKKQFCWNSVSSSDMLSTFDIANMLFAFVPVRAYVKRF